MCASQESIPLWKAPWGVITSLALEAPSLCKGESTIHGTVQTKTHSTCPANQSAAQHHHAPFPSLCLQLGSTWAGKIKPFSASFMHWRITLWKSSPVAQSMHLCGHSREGQNFPSTVSSEEFNQTDLILRKKWAIFAIMQHASSNCL